MVGPNFGDATVLCLETDEKLLYFISFGLLFTNNNWLLACKAEVKQLIFNQSSSNALLAITKHEVSVI